MNVLHYAPIEPLPERYSAQWHEWFLEAFKGDNRHVILHGDDEVREIKTGEFLDAYETNAYKARQLASIIDSLQEVQKPSTVFFMDAWFPGVEALAYIRQVANRPIYLSGILHAGCYDQNDHLSWTGCGPWGSLLEQAWLELYDELFVATHYHRDLLIRTYGQRRAKLTVVPFPVVTQPDDDTEKRQLVVFPHRLAPEKQPEHFELLQGVYSDLYPDEEVEWLMTAKQRPRFDDAMTFKTWYYEQLAAAKVVFSSALQETFGIAMLEGVAYGAWPVAPDRLSYCETLAEFPRYASLEEAAELVHEHLEKDAIPFSRFDENVRHFIERLP
jgi:hypothetical protein